MSIALFSQLFLTSASADSFVDSQLAWHQLVTTTSGFLLDDTGYLNDQQYWARSRIITGYQKQHNQLEYKLGLELINTQIFGQESDLGRSVNADIFRVSKHNFDSSLILPRELSIGYQASKIGMNIGIQSFDWGLGILSNSGTGESRFGLKEQGNIYARAALFRPPQQETIPLISFIAVDYILRDENAYWLAEDQAWQIVSGLRLLHPVIEAGLLGAIRTQTDRPDSSRQTASTSQAFPIDVYAIYRPNASWTFATEGVAVQGTTNRIYTEQTRGEDAQIRYLGAVLRGTHQFNRGDNTIKTELESGYASGDANAGDNQARSFAFHSDYTVSLLLYNEILPRLQARSADRLADPGLSGQPATGLQYTVTQGSVHNSTYLQLCNSWENETLLIRTGLLHALSAVPLSDAYQTAIFGGYNRDLSGSQSESRNLGTELDIRIQYTLKKKVSLGADLGYFHPGSALSIIDPTMKAIGYVRFQAGEK